MLTEFKRNRFADAINYGFGDQERGAMGPLVLDALPRYYSLVILNVVLNWVILMWQALKVGTARGKYNVKYPTLYENKGDSTFNCVQRAHQNSLEWNPGFLVFLLLGGLSCPLTSAVAALVYNVGRVYYALGYYKGNPHKGMWGFYGLFVLIGCTIWTAIAVLR